MAEVISKATAARLKKSLVNAGNAEASSDRIAAKKLGMTLEEYQRYLTRLANEAAQKKTAADRLFPSMGNK